MRSGKHDELDRHAGALLLPARDAPDQVVPCLGQTPEGLRVSGFRA